MRNSRAAATTGTERVETSSDFARATSERVPAPHPALWRLDLHMHTHHSRDCTIPTAEVIRLCRRRGLDGIAVTDHNTLAGGLEAVALAPAGFTLIPREGG